MRFVDIINKKRYNEELTDKEIQFFVDGVTDGSIPDYQVSAHKHALYFLHIPDLQGLHLR